MLGEPIRQRRYLTELQRRVPVLPWVDAVVVIGSLAADRADGASDVDLLICLRGGAFDEAWRHRDDLHATGAVLAWDHWLDPGGQAGTHKWLTLDFVLVETLIAEPTSPVRLAPPWHVLAGNPAAAERWPARGPISPTEVQTRVERLHPAELAYDLFKQRLRRAGADITA
jgi:Nucleotidyltransferase domain